MKLLRNRRPDPVPPASDVAGEIVKRQKENAEDVLDDALAELEEAVAKVREAVEAEMPKPRSTAR
jgi:hypothetical protein